MQDDQTTKAVDDLIKKVEDSGESPSGPTLADNPASNPSQQPVSSSPDTSSSEQTAPVSPISEPDIQQSAPKETAAPSDSSENSLDPIKKEALQKLEPLISELDLNPEEKYRALMMIIQANDNKDLVAEAYQAADKIEDTKVRAQALLSIINEIDYFNNKNKISG